MVGQRQSPTSDASYLRKIRKPLIERKRRERMNNSLTQLKSLLAATIRENTSPNAKLDKADILELTVSHLTQLQQQQTAVTMATEAASYSSGFKDCAKATIGYVTSTRLMDDTCVCNLSNHLHNSFLARTGSPTPDQLNAYHAPEQQPEYTPNVNSSDARLELSSYATSTSPYYGYYDNKCYDNDSYHYSEAAVMSEQKQMYKVKDNCLAVAHLIEDHDKVWRPW